MDKSLTKVDWPELISQQAAFSADRIVVNGLLVDAGFFYRSDSKVFLSDSTVLAHVQDCFSAIQGAAFDLDLGALRRRACKSVDSPFPNLHADFEIYNHRLYGGMPEGLFTSNTSDEAIADKLWDSSVYAVRASTSYSTVAVAAGDEGLWEYDTSVSNRSRGSGQISLSTKHFCTACDWGEQSIFGWSGSTGGFLASYYTAKYRGETRSRRVFDKTIDAKQLYGADISFWGSHDRAYALDGDELVVVDYDPKAVERTMKLKRTAESTKQNKQPQALVPDAEPLQSKTVRKLNAVAGVGQRPVAVATAPFGTVIQFDNHIYVFRSDGGMNEITGNIVTWRVFPRSLHYANQLHVVLEDRVEIYAFVHDFFVPQENKVFGFRMGSRS